MKAFCFRDGDPAINVLEISRCFTIHRVVMSHNHKTLHPTGKIDLDLLSIHQFMFDSAIVYFPQPSRAYRFLGRCTTPYMVYN